MLLTYYDKRIPQSNLALLYTNYLALKRVILDFLSNNNRRYFFTTTNTTGTTLKLLIKVGE